MVVAELLMLFLRRMRPRLPRQRARLDGAAHRRGRGRRRLPSGGRPSRQTVRADNLPGERRRIRCRLRVSDEAGPVLRFDQLPFTGKARELEHLDISPAHALDLTAKRCISAMIAESSQAKYASALRLSKAVRSQPGPMWADPRRPILWRRTPTHDRCARYLRLFAA